MTISNDFMHKKYAKRAGEIFGITDWNNDLNLIRIYHQLSVLVGGDEKQMRYWMQTPNKHIKNKVPASLVVTSEGTRQLIDLLNSYQN